MGEPVAHLVHGFNVADGGRSSMGPVVPFVERTCWTPKFFTWGWSDLIRLRWLTKRAAKDLAKELRDGDICITHSHGWNVAMRAARKRPDIRIQILGYNPAARRDVDLPDAVERAVVCYAKDDSVLAWGAWWRKFARINPRRWCKPHPWGRLGKEGPRNESERLRSLPMPEGTGHSGPKVFAEAILIARQRRFLLPPPS